jgi:hypothetical protein
MTHLASKVSLSNLLPCELELELLLPKELDLKSHIYGQRHLCAWKHQKKEHITIERKSHKNQASIYLQAWLQNFGRGKPKHRNEANEPNRAKVQMARGTDYVHQPQLWPCLDELGRVISWLVVSWLVISLVLFGYLG